MLAQGKELLRMCSYVQLELVSFLVQQIKKKKKKKKEKEGKQPLGPTSPEDTRRYNGILTQRGNLSLTQLKHSLTSLKSDYLINLNPMKNSCCYALEAECG